MKRRVYGQKEVEEDSYPGPKPRTVNRFSRRDVLRSGDIERVGFLFALGTAQLDVSFAFRSSKIDRGTQGGSDDQDYGCWKLVVWHDCQ